jgi:beta-lactamase class A
VGGVAGVAEFSRRRRRDVTPPRRAERRQRRRRRRRRSPVLVVPVVVAVVAVTVGGLAVALRRRHSSAASLSSVGASSTRLLAAASAAGRTNPFPALRAYLDHRDGNITAAVYEVDTHRTYLYRPDVREPTASIMKVDILATLLHQARDRGGLLTGAQAAIAEEMIEASDNDDAQDLWNAEGGSTAVSAFNEEAHMGQTSPNTAGFWGLSTTTALDQVALLKRVLLPGHLLDRVSRVYADSLMRDIDDGQNWGVSAGVPADVHVALKNGWLPLSGDDWQVNSIGAIVGEGRHYLITVLTDGDPTEGYGIRTIEHIARATWKSSA